jgi:hypothetical protein
VANSSHNHKCPAHGVTANGAMPISAVTATTEAHSRYQGYNSVARAKPYNPQKPSRRVSARRAERPSPANPATIAAATFASSGSPLTHFTGGNIAVKTVQRRWHGRDAKPPLPADHRAPANRNGRSGRVSAGNDCYSRPTRNCTAISATNDRIDGGGNAVPATRANRGQHLSGYPFVNNQHGRAESVRPC